MASTDLEYIRALLIAQTAVEAPPRRGIGGLFGAAKAPRAPLMLDMPRRPPPVGQPRGRADEPALLLDRLCGPSLGVEAASALAPPVTRAMFGRRPDAAPETELMLDRPAVEARRLRVLDPSGQAIGEMIFQPLPTYETGEDHAAPFFNEDFLEPARPEPMRPWIKALRDSGPPKPPAARPAPPAKPMRPLGYNLLEALALSLSREHEALSDRLLFVGR